MLNSNNELEGLIERVKDFLPQYLETQGINLTPKGLFKCINPDHNDSNPSAGVIPGSDNKIFHCFSCCVSGNIFLAAHYLEGKPLNGPGFVTDNVIYLAKKFGIDVPSMGELSDDTLHEMELYRAYSNATNLIKNAKFSDKVKEHIAKLGWPENVMKQIGIGSVTSYNDFIKQMTVTYKHSMEFLKGADLDRRLIFSENNLIFSIKDENGNTVGFSARNLNYDQQKIEFEKGEISNPVQLGLGLDIGTVPKPAEFVFRPVKYINTDAKCYIYKKSRRLFNFNLAKKHAPPLYVFEGYTDVVTSYVAGLKNGCSIGSTSFSKDHLELVLNTGIKHIIFVLDADNAGEAGTERFIKLLEENLGGIVGLRVEIVTMPEGSDDPDAYIRAFGFKDGLANFLKLEKIDVFTWTLRKGIASGKDPIELAQNTIPLIVNESNYLIRMKMAEQLAGETKLDKAGIWAEVMRQVDSESSRLQEERSIIARMAAKDLTSGKDIEAVLEAARHKLDTLELTKTGYDPLSISKTVNIILNKAKDNKEKIEISLGFPYTDQCLNGLPASGIFALVPGKPNQGKSTFLDNMAWRLVENNKDCIVLLHSVDDSLSQRIPRFLGSKFNIPSEYFKKAGYYLENIPDNCPTFPEVYREAVAWLNKQVDDEKLILADVSVLGKSLISLDGWVKNLRQRFPNKKLVFMGDNFHLYDLPGFKKDAEGLKEMSSYIKTMCNKYDAVGIFTMELPKDSLKPGIRPKIQNIKGSGGMAYDGNVNFGVYNDLKDMKERSDIFWTDPSDLENKITADGTEVSVPKKKPILEIVIDKSKISSFDGSIFFRMDPVTGRIEECSLSEQEMLVQKVASSTSKKQEYANAGQRE